MEQILLIADYILRIGGAIGILFLLIILGYIISVLRSINSMLRGAKQQIAAIEQSVIAPMGMLGSFFGVDGKGE